MADLFAALLHYPVLDRNGRTIASAITSLDIHDLARSARTYEVRRLFILHPVAEQRDFAQTVLAQWLKGNGRQFDSRRREALARVEILAELDQAIERIERLSGARPILIHTSAKTGAGSGYNDVRTRLEAPGAPLLLMFGTGFGFTEDVMARCDLALIAVRGPGDYNHLSVRAAASIILDRLRGR